MLFNRLLAEANSSEGYNLYEYPGTLGGSFIHRSQLQLTANRIYLHMALA